MKILFLNNSDSMGGAAKAAFRLYDSMSDFGVETRMLVRFKDTSDKNVIEINKHFKIINKLRKKLENLVLKKYQKRKKNIFSTAILKAFLTRKIKKINPDIIHIHWIGSAFMDMNSFLEFKKPIVWTLHDSWAFTGGCHVPFDCKKYETKCTKCPVLGSNMENDLSTFVWEHKNKVYKNIDLNIVSPSTWLAICAKSSPLLYDKNITLIPNGIDIDTFSKSLITKEITNLQIDKSKKYILFSGDTLDKNKAFDKLLEAFELLQNVNNLEILVIGSERKNNIDLNKNTKINYLGYIKDESILISIYNLVSVAIVPSLQENLPNTIIESLACYTPVVAFNIGGNGDMIDHKINGYLAKPFDTIDLAQGIDWVLNNEKYDELCENARKKVVKKFDSRVVAKQYIKLYENILNNKKYVTK